MNTALVRSVARGYESSVHEAYKTKLRWGFLASLALFAVALWYFIHGNTTLGACFIIGATLAPLKDTFETYLYLWNGKKRFGLRLIYDTTIAMATSAGIVLARVGIRANDCS